MLDSSARQGIQDCTGHNLPVLAPTALNRDSGPTTVDPGAEVARRPGDPPHHAGSPWPGGVLRRSRRRPRPLDCDVGNDAWDGCRQQRNRIAAGWVARGTPNPVVLTATYTATGPPICSRIRSTPAVPTSASSWSPPRSRVADGGLLTVRPICPRTCRTSPTRGTATATCGAR